MKVQYRHRVLGAFEITLLIGVLLGQGAFLLAVVGVAAGVAT